MTTTEIQTKNMTKKKIQITERPYHQYLGDHSAKYWKDGSTEIMVYPELKDPKNSKPFIVRLCNDHYIPVNELVYALDEDEAKERLLAAMRWTSKHDYHDRGSPYMRPGEDHYLKGFDNGSMWFEIELLDITSIVSVEWST